MFRMVRRNILFVCSLLLLGTVAVRAQQTLTVPAELVWYPDSILHNGKILTVDQNFRIAEAVAIRDGVFLEVGTNQDILRLRGPATKVLNLQGRTVIPGLVVTDGDGVPIGGSFYKETQVGGKLMGQQSYVNSKRAVLNAVKKYVAERPAGELIHIWTNKEVAEVMDMTKADLDPLSPNHLVSLNVSSFDMVVNSAMLEDILEVLPGGENHPSVVKDADGKPNGQIFGFALGVASWDLRPWPKITEELLQEQKEAFMSRNRLGQTAIVGHTHGFDLTVMNVLYHRNEMTLRFYISHDMLRSNPNAEAMLRRLGNISEFGLGDMVKIVGLGLEAMDGAPVSGSSLTMLPKISSANNAFLPQGKNNWYAYGTKRADINPRQTEWVNVNVGIKYGYNTTGIHNTGDLSRQIWMDTIQKALEAPDLVLRPQFRPFGLDHNLFWSPSQYEQAKSLNMRFGLGYFQDDGGAGSALLYGDRIHDVQPIPELIRNGIRVNLEGADLEGMEKLITRRGSEGAIWGPDHAIDRPTALRMATIWSARYFGEDGIIGSIEKGKKADMAVLGADYLTVPEDEIGEIPVVATIVGGKVVFGSL